MADRATPLVPALVAGVLAAGLCAAPALAQKPTPAITAAVADKGRPEADTKRDADRKPAEIVAFAGVKPGMSVEELFPGGGYYTRILSKVVGPKGKMFLVTPAEMKDRARAGSPTPAQTSDNLAKEVGNATVVWQPADSPMAPEKVDVVWSTDNYHDYRNPGFGAVDMAKFNKAAFDSLKPGGVFIIEDYEAAPGAGASHTNDLHRIESAQVKKEVEAAGFKFDGMSEVLQNKADDHTLAIFNPMIRGHADQYVLKFVKPK
ncbi:MAG TPA: methyltransferase [Caulobacteraceae bacterium]|jgi:predicted methyltransferase